MPFPGAQTTRRFVDMTRVAVASALVIALATGVWLLWPDDEQPPSTTVPIAASSTTVPSTTSSSPGTTSTTNHVVDSVEEAETILRRFWFGWYSGLHQRDEDLIRTLVVTEDQVQTAVSRFGSLAFERAPVASDFVFVDTEILRSDSDCLAIWSEFSPPFLEMEGTTSGVQVLRWERGQWRSLSYWRYRSDLWEEDCAVALP